MKKLAHHIIHIKLLIGLLWLMLRANSVRAQELRLPGGMRCYKPIQYPKTEIFLLNDADISISEKANTIHLDHFSTSVQWGHNFRKMTYGAELELFRKSEKPLIGPYIRVFPFDKSRPAISCMLELKYLISTEKYFGSDALSISTGFILSNHGFDTGILGLPLGIELYESMTTDLTEPSGVAFYTGIRVHYYITGL